LAVYPLAGSTIIIIEETAEIFVPAKVSTESNVLPLDADLLLAPRDSIRRRPDMSRIKITMFTRYLGDF
jgi:hypothetical protein